MRLLSFILLAGCLLNLNLVRARGTFTCGAHLIDERAAKSAIWIFICSLIVGFTVVPVSLFHHGVCALLVALRIMQIAVLL